MIVSHHASDLLTGLPRHPRPGAGAPTLSTDRAAGPASTVCGLRVSLR
ncbi:hypothetical protein [Micromonospora violae]|nr:hypothetical protein [Micromonospora violae]